MSVYFLTTFFESSLSNELAQRNRKGNNRGISDENANDLVINLLKKENQSQNASDRTGWVKISPYLDSPCQIFVWKRIKARYILHILVEKKKK